MLTDKSDTNTAKSNTFVATVRESTKCSKERVLSILEKTGGYSIKDAAEASRISRDSFYRWLREDDAFKNKVMEIRESINDQIEDNLITKALNGDGQSIRFYLSHRHPMYKQERYQQIMTKTLEDLIDEMEK